MPTAAPSAAAPNHDSSIKETVTSIVIAFVVAFVFRGFVLEPFLIPTGSMAPTLMGAHMRFTGPDSGYTWPVGPWSYADPQTRQIPERVQRGPRDGPIIVHDPMTAQELIEPGVISRAGDRIFVLKSLYNVFDPRRFEVIVFKNPNNPQENYIKRLTGLPGEQIAIVDGDIFTRRLAGLPASSAREGLGAWDDPAWRIARKPERVQLAVWQPVFDSRFTPLTSLRGTGSEIRSPWAGSGPGWEIEGRRTYAFGGSGRTALLWLPARPAPYEGINDFCPYNETGPSISQVVFPVSDVRVCLAVKPTTAGQSVAFDLQARDHEFRAEISGRSALLRMRAASGGEGEPWKTLAEATLERELEAARVTDIEFWHVDQALSLYVGGARVLHAEYDWTPAQRVRAATGLDMADAMLDGTDAAPVVHPERYQRPELKIEFEGGAFEVERAAIWRDLYYQPCSPADPRGRRAVATGATPFHMPALSEDQFFVCGDNSPASLDARLWQGVDPWVSAQVDPTIGVVNRELLVGRAFFVYFPAPVPTRNIWMPDFGRLRFIW